MQEFKKQVANYMYTQTMNFIRSKIVKISQRDKAAHGWKRSHFYMIYFSDLIWSRNNLKNLQEQIKFRIALIVDTNIWNVIWCLAYKIKLFSL